jgi:hypothetical protein
VLPPIDDDDPAEVKSAIAVRNAASVERTCPACGAVAEFYADRTRPWLGHLVFRHSAECRALTDGEAA